MSACALFFLSLFGAAFAQGLCPGGQVTVPQNGAAYVVSPNYPNNYSNNANCYYDITGPVGKGLEFTSLEFLMEGPNCNYDSVAFNETVNGRWKTLGRFCGEDGPMGLRSFANQVKVNFRTDGSVTSKGYLLAVKVALCPAESSPCPGTHNQTVCIHPTAFCDGKDDCPNGVDEDPRKCRVENCGKPAIRPITYNSTTTTVSPVSDADRIIGGIPAIPHSHPWQCALILTEYDHQSCGCSIINDEWVLTAAHCCRAQPAVPATYNVFVGAHSLGGFADQPYARKLPVSKVILHPRYESPFQNSHDACLVKLAEPLQFNDHVSPVCLSNGTVEAVGKSCIVSGWGRTDYWGPGGWGKAGAHGVPTEHAGEGNVLQRKDSNARLEQRVDILQQALADIVAQPACTRAWSSRVISDDMICAEAPGQSGCNGDSGGPLACEDQEKTFHLAGIVSFGIFGCYPGPPPVYGRVSNMRSWILETMFNN